MKLVYGVGINDAKDIIQKFDKQDGKWKRTWICPYYATWKGMLRRCYSIKYISNRQSYSDCFVITDWLTFSNFKAWMETQDWQGKQLDKDLLFYGNKVYSPETCVFVSSQVNCFVLESNATRGKLPIGVSWNNSGPKKFISRCRNPFLKKEEYLGRFDTPEEAHEAWLVRKLELAKLLAAEQSDIRVARALVERYENYYSMSESRAKKSEE